MLLLRVMLLRIMCNGDRLLLLIPCERYPNLNLHGRLKLRPLILSSQRPSTSSCSRSSNRLTRSLAWSYRLPIIAWNGTTSRSHRCSLLAARHPKPRHPRHQIPVPIHRVGVLCPGSSTLSTTFILLVANLSSYGFLCAESSGYSLCEWDVVSVALGGGRGGTR